MPQQKTNSFIDLPDDKIFEEFNSYRAPRLKSATIKKNFQNGILIVAITYERILFGQPFEYQDLAIVFGEVPNITPAEAIYFDLVDLYLPSLNNLKLVDSTKLESNPTVGEKVDLSGKLVALPGGLDVVLPVCLNWRTGPEKDVQHPCLQDAITTAPLGGGKAICTFAATYERQLNPLDGVKTLPLLFYMDKSEFLDDQDDLTKIGTLFVEHFATQEPDQMLFIKNFDGMFLCPMILPGNSGIMFYCFPNRDGMFTWRAVGGHTEIDPKCTSKARCGERLRKHETVGRTKRIVLGVNDRNLLPIESWSNIVSLQGMF